MTRLNMLRIQVITSFCGQVKFVGISHGKKGNWQ